MPLFKEILSKTRPLPIPGVPPLGGGYSPEPWEDPTPSPEWPELPTWEDIQDVFGMDRHDEQSESSTKAEAKTKDAKEEQCEQCPPCHQGMAVSCPPTAKDQKDMTNFEYQQRYRYDVPSGSEWAFHIANRNPQSMAGMSCHQVRSNGMAVTFDGFKRAECLLIECKGNYDVFVDKSDLFEPKWAFWFDPKDQIIPQAERQIAATEDPRVFLEWYCMQHDSHELIEEALKEAKMINNMQIRAVELMP